MSALHAIAETVTAATTPAAREAASRSIWRSWSAGELTDGQAQSLADELEAGKPSRGKGAGFAPIAANRPRVRRAISERIQHRRRLAASGPLPPALASRFTTGEMAVLRIVGDEFVRNGVCDLTIGELADRAQVGRSTVQSAMRHAAGLLTVREQRRRGGRNGPNLVKIINPEWLTWLRLRPLTRRAEAFPPLGSKMPTPQTNNNKSSSFHKKRNGFGSVDDGKPPAPEPWRGRGQAGSGAEIAA